METKKGIEDINNCFENYCNEKLVSVIRFFIENLRVYGFNNVNIDLSVKINAKSGDSKIGTTKKFSII